MVFTLGGMEDWSKVEELVTAGNLMGLGIFDFNGIAQCLGNDTLGRYMVYEYFDWYWALKMIYLKPVWNDKMSSFKLLEFFLQMHISSLPGMAETPDMKVGHWKSSIEW